MEPLGIYNPLSGITTNQSEGFNTLLKRYEQWREAPLDSMILGLYFLQKYYHNEVQRGYGGIGSYSLLSQYAFADIPLDEILTSIVLSPEEIVDKIKNNQIGHSSINFTQTSSTGELRESRAAQSSDSKSTEELLESHAAQLSDSKSTGEIHESRSSDSKSTEGLLESHAAQLSDTKSTGEIHESRSSDSKSTEGFLESHAAQLSDTKSTEEIHESRSSDSKSTEELLESHTAQLPDTKLTEEVYETTNTTQYARARYLYV